MSSPNCSSCEYHRLVKAKQKLSETGEKVGFDDEGTWNEFDRSICLHPNADLGGKYKRDKHGGVRIGLICWTCRDRWHSGGVNDNKSMSSV